MAKKMSKKKSKGNFKRWPEGESKWTPKKKPKGSNPYPEGGSSMNAPKGYTIITFKGRKGRRFRCNRCGADLQSKVRFEHHWDTTHKDVKPKGRGTWFDEY